MALNNFLGGVSLRIAIGIMALVLLLASSVSAATQISQCTTISSPGNYILTNDITNAVTDPCIYIISSGVTLDGAGFTITGGRYNTGVDVYNISSIADITVKNLKAKNWNRGISYQNVLNGKILNNTVTSNLYNGIYLINWNCRIPYYICRADGNIIANNNVSYSRDGIYIEYVNKNILINNTVNSNGLISTGIYLGYSNDNILIDNNMSLNQIGIFGNGKNNTLINNTMNSNSFDGAVLTPEWDNATMINNTVNWNVGSGFNMNGVDNGNFTGNTLLYNGEGIFLGVSNNNNLTGNNASSNRHYGFQLANSNSNTFMSNNISNNSYAGIQLNYLSNNNIIYNNYFNNTFNFMFDPTSSNIWNITKRPGKNIVGGPYIGGNFWTNQSNKGYSNTCADIDSNGICDLQYSLMGSNIDYRPLSMNFIMTSSITVTSPNGGENWARSTTQTIRWNYSGSPGNRVKIELLKNGTFNRMINSSTPTGSGGSGSYRWLINASQAPGTNYKVRVTSTTNASYKDTSNKNFTISGGITVTSPNGGETWQRGTMQTIRWTYSGTPGSRVKIELLKNGAFNRTINSNTSIGSSGSGSYNWLINVSQAPGSDYKVRVKSISNAAYIDTSNNNFNISGP